MFKQIFKSLYIVLLLLIFTNFLFSQEVNKVETALAKAVLEGKLEEVKTLLQNGAKVDERSFGKSYIGIDTSLFIASDSLASYSFYCSYSIDLLNKIYTKHNNIGVTPLQIAAYKGNSKIVQLLLEHNSDIEAKTFEGGTPLMLALISENIETINLLLSAKANINTQSGRGKTILMIASWNSRHSRLERSEILRKLISLGADVNLKDSARKTVLMGVAEENNVELAKILIQAKAELESADNEGKTALMYAIEAQNLEMTKFLVENKANVNAIDNNGETPLMYAVINNRADEIVQILLDNGADVKATEKNGVGTAFLKANLFNYPKTAKILEKARASLSLNEKLVLAVSKGNLEEVKQLLNQGANANAKAFGGKSVLAFASMNDFQQIVELLIEKGADVNQIDNEGKTPLIDVSDFGLVKVAELLIERGANINAKNKNGYTALMCATEQGKTDFVKMLLEKNAEVNTQLENGFTALDIAEYMKAEYREKDNDSIISMLEKAGGKRMAKDRN